VHKAVEARPQLLGLDAGARQRLLVDENMNPRVVMQVGGWSSFQAIEPYLNAPTEDVVDEAFASVNAV
jgi:hypothetical protein